MRMQNHPRLSQLSEEASAALQDPSMEALLPVAQTRAKHSNDQKSEKALNSKYV